jgi:predicted TIM-barrel fold metal-dependent hydrolase
VGTDYPFDMGMDEVHEFLAAVPSITENELKDILGANAKRLFGW